MITASAVYLVRPRSDPSKAWLVAVEEPVPGKLVLRHALTHKEMNSDAELDLEPDWIAATQTPIARLYACHRGRFSTRKLVCESERSQESGCSQLVGFYTVASHIVNFAIKLELGGGLLKATQLNAITEISILDCVKFNGGIFTVDGGGRIYVADHHTTNLQLVQGMPVRWGYERYGNWYRFVVSDGDLYLVWVFYNDYNDCGCEIYRLNVTVEVVTNNGDGGTCCVRKILSKRIWDLGDRVFFITQACSFSISARLLPDPWQREGNCVFISDIPGLDGVVFRLQTLTGLWNPEGHSYSDLFSPPTSSDSTRPVKFMSSGKLRAETSFRSKKKSSCLQGFLNPCGGDFLIKICEV